MLEDGGQSTKCGLIKSNQFPREKCQRKTASFASNKTKRIKRLCVTERMLGMKGGVAGALTVNMQTLARQVKLPSQG